MFPLSGLVGTFTSLASPTCLITLTPPPPTALLVLLLLWMWGGLPIGCERRQVMSVNLQSAFISDDILAHAHVF